MGEIQSLRVEGKSHKYIRQECKFLPIVHGFKNIIEYRKNFTTMMVSNKQASHKEIEIEIFIYIYIYMCMFVSQTLIMRPKHWNVIQL